MPEIPFILTCLDIQTHFHSTLPAAVSHRGAIDKFSPETVLSFLEVEKFVRYIGFGILIDEKWQKCC